MEGSGTPARGAVVTADLVEGCLRSAHAEPHAGSAAALQGSNPVSERRASECGTTSAVELVTCSSLQRIERILELKKVIDRAKAELETGSQASASGGSSQGVTSTSSEVMRVVDALAVLDRVEMTRDVLAKTRIGVSVGKLRTHPDMQIRSRCTQLVQKWKAGITATSSSGKDSGAATRPGQNGGCSRGNSPASPSKAGAAVEKEPAGLRKAAAQDDSSSQGVAGGAAPENHSTLEGYPGPASGDAVRDRARGFLWRALVQGMQTGRNAGADKSRETARVAAEVEKALWQEYCVKRKSTKEYNMQLKTLKWNFADQKNPDLNLKVLCGVYTPEQLAVMSSADLASDEKKRMRELQKKEMMEACQSDWEMKKLMDGGTDGGQFPCFKCRTTKTVYFQMQTRSSDEPMTTFVTCLECGNRWKF
ncbi:transcription elongation factor A TFIIS [Besnoitia besnoiti]|uniref:Transcription elongation factor A TFIIS n=1 Tax=Besnoitia besnoiti TaxID=94643 RepID=A0A2A9MBL8_BESBE|nr:transcription elongation factor A TFIIS [Besnoitia besnoiti]PFH33073.1 transcription elongation factor A TFIIS [Besnoitia besnoiti]